MVLITLYCPACWQEVAEGESRCTACGFELSWDQRLSFEEKLLRTLEHPVQERRLLAIWILGNLGSQAAWPTFEKLLQNPRANVYELRETLVALSKIQGFHSLEMLRAARQHPYPAIRRLAERLLENARPE